MNSRACLSSLDYIEPIPEEARAALIERLHRMGSIRLARQLEDCCRRLRLGPSGMEEPLRCRKRVCPTCAPIEARQTSAKHTAVLLAELGSGTKGLLLTLTAPPAREGFLEGALLLHRNLRRFTDSWQGRAIRRADPSFGSLTAFEIGPGVARPGHPHGHILLVSEREDSLARAAEACQMEWLRRYQEASWNAQDVGPVVSSFSEVERLIGYTTKGTRLDPAWPDHILRGVIEMLTTRLRLITGCGSFRKQPALRARK